MFENLSPVLCLHSCTLESSFPTCLKSLSKSLMIHATVLSRPWPCSWEMSNLWTKHMKSIPPSSNQSSKLFRSYKIWSCKEISKRNLHCFWPLPLLVLSASSEHAPVELDGKDTVHGRNDVEQFQRKATAHITFTWICHFETSSIHLFKNNQSFETVQNYCLRSLLFSRWRSLAKIFSWQLLHLHIEILILR